MLETSSTAEAITTSHTRMPLMPHSEGLPLRFLDALHGCSSALIAVGLFSAVVNILYLTGSFYMLQVYDRVMTSRSIPTLIGLSVLAALLRWPGTT